MEPKSGSQSLTSKQKDTSLQDVETKNKETRRRLVENARKLCEDALAIANEIRSSD